MAEICGEVLVAIVNNPFDLAMARDQHWYRIPVSSAEKWLKDRWPPQWLAFYQTKVFASEAHAVNYYARVEMRTYCVPVISENINRLGGVDDARVVPRKVDPDAPDGTIQPSLFDDL